MWHIFKKIAFVDKIAVLFFFNKMSSKEFFKSLYRNGGAREKEGWQICLFFTSTVSDVCVHKIFIIL